MSLTIEQLNTAHPSGEYYPEHGCYYFIDHDGDLGYFIQYNTGEFENEANWVDIDTLEEDLQREVLAVAHRISTTA